MYRNAVCRIFRYANAAAPRLVVDLDAGERAREQRLRLICAANVQVLESLFAATSQQTRPSRAPFLVHQPMHLVKNQGVAAQGCTLRRARQHKSAWIDLFLRSNEPHKVWRHFRAKQQVHLARQHAQWAGINKSAGAEGVAVLRCFNGTLQQELQSVVRFAAVGGACKRRLK